MLLGPLRIELEPLEELAGGDREGALQGGRGTAEVIRQTTTSDDQKKSSASLEDRNV